MRIIFVASLSVFLYTITLYARVGIGTTNPTAELEIVTTNAGIPVLELNPQNAPAGTATGQFAVVGDQLYMYDATRIKWLSTETTALIFWLGGFCRQPSIVVRGGY